MCVCVCYEYKIIIEGRGICNFDGCCCTRKFSFFRPEEFNGLYVLLYFFHLPYLHYFNGNVAPN